MTAYPATDTPIYKQMRRFLPPGEQICLNCAHLPECRKRIADKKMVICENADAMNADDYAVLNYVIAHGPVNARQIISALDIKVHVFESTSAFLRNTGQIVRVGHGRYCTPDVQQKQKRVRQGMENFRRWNKRRIKRLAMEAR